MIPVQAPQYRQYVLISDFLDLARLSIQEEAAFATNWIKDRPEGLKLQNLALATMTGPALSNLQRKLTADVQYAIHNIYLISDQNINKSMMIHAKKKEIFNYIHSIS